MSAFRRIREEMKAAKGLGSILFDDQRPVREIDGRQTDRAVKDGPLSDGVGPLLSVAPTCGTMPGLIADRGATFYFCG